jgi:hypothetical protein
MDKNLIDFKIDVEQSGLLSFVLISVGFNIGLFHVGIAD